jgi:catechol 2,3-dioxygenase-like lactoylglutathione lyase family enzyme
MPVTGLDHIAMPTADAERLLTFYKRLGFTSPDEADWRAGRRQVFALAFGDNKINVHPEGFTAALRAPEAMPGSADLCFVWEGGVEALQRLLAKAGVEPITEPVTRTGGRGGGTREGLSVYARDPDGNLIEFINYQGG